MPICGMDRCWHRCVRDDGWQGVSVSLSSCIQKSDQAKSQCQALASGDGGIIKATFWKDSKIRKAQSKMKIWVSGSKMTHSEKRKRLLWATRYHDQSQLFTVRGENCFPILVGGISPISLLLCLLISATRITNQP